MIKKIMLLTHDGYPENLEEYLKNPDLQMPNLMYFDNLNLDLFTKIDDKLIPKQFEYTSTRICFPNSSKYHKTTFVNIRNVDTSRKWYIENYDSLESISYLEEFIEKNKEENFAEYCYNYTLTR